MALSIAVHTKTRRRQRNAYVVTDWHGEFPLRIFHASRRAQSICRICRSHARHSNGDDWGNERTRPGQLKPASMPKSNKDQNVPGPHLRGIVTQSSHPSRSAKPVTNQARQKMMGMETSGVTGSLVARGSWMPQWGGTQSSKL